MKQLIPLLRTRAQAQGGPELRLAVTGHQALDGATTEMFLSQAFGSLLGELQRAGRAPVILSGLAAGADMLFAETALAHACPLEVCLACVEIEANFASGAMRERFRTLRDQSRVIHQLPFIARSSTAYRAMGRWLVDSGDLLIAAWNGLPAVDEGGTGAVVAYALGQGRPVIHLHTRTHRVSCLTPPEAGLPRSR